MSSSTYNPVITLTSLSTQQGEINLVTNPIAENNVSSWTTSSATLTRSTTGVLSPVIPTGFSASSTTSTTSYVQTSLLTVPATLRNRKLKVQLYIQCADTATWKVDVLKSDGSTRYTLSTDSSGVSALPALTGTYTTTFDMDTGSGIYVRLTRYAGSGTSTLSFTNLIVGPGIQPQGAVAQEWQSYTPTFEGLGTVTNASGRYRRVGDSIQVEFVATSGVNTAVLLNTILPISLNWDSTKLFNNANVGKFNTNQTPFSGGILAFTSQGTTKVSLVADNASILSGSVGTAWANSTTFSGTFTAPIAEWSGSGTVQLAQNDVEYAYNTSTSTTANDSSSFGYGPEGAIIRAITAGLFRRCRFQTPIQPTDVLQVEVKPSTGSQWISVSAVPSDSGATNSIIPQVNLNGTTYGILLRQVNNTDVDVVFGTYPATAGATTFGGAAFAWGTGTNPPSAWSWRVRKSSAGAAVGFGIVNSQSAGLFPVSNSNLDDATATRLGLKQYLHGTTYNGGIAPTVTSAQAGFNVVRSIFIPYQAQDGAWRLKLSIVAGFTSASVASLTLTINGVVSKNIVSFFQNVSAWLNGTTSYFLSCYFNPGTGNILVNANSNTSTFVSCSADIELESKPTWAY